MKTKTCNKCKKSKPSTSKYFPQDYGSGNRRELQTVCKECTKIYNRLYQRKRREKDPNQKEKEAKAAIARYHQQREIHGGRAYANDPKRAASMKMTNLKRLYDLSFNDLHNLLYKQQGECAACRKDLGLKYHIDHCHKTGQVRGILCPRCNQVLGHLGDTVEAIKVRYFQLMSYLESC